MENNMSLQNELKTILLVEDEALIAINEESILDEERVSSENGI